MSDLHCPATLLLAPYDEGAERPEGLTQQITERLAADRVSRVYGGAGPEAVQTTRSLAGGVGAPAEERVELDSGDVAGELQAIADLHRGETVLVVLPGGVAASAIDALAGRVWARTGPSMHYGALVEMFGDADGWTLRARVSPTDSVS